MNIPNNTFFRCLWIFSAWRYARHSHHSLSAAHESFFCLFNQYFLLYIVCEGRYSFFIKKKFLFRCPHTLTIRLKCPVYRGFSGEGKCEGVRVNRMKNWKLAFPSAAELRFLILHSTCSLALCSHRLTERNAAILSSYNIYNPNTTLKEPAFNCSFVHKVEYCCSTPIEVLQYFYWSTPVLLIGLLQYLHWITPVLLIGLLQYLHWITPVLL